MLDNRIEFMDCYASLAGNVLTAGNSGITRTYAVTGSGLVPQTLTDAAAGETLTEENGEDISPVTLRGEMPRKLTLEGGADDDLGFGAKSLKCSLTAVYPRFCLKYEIVLYPALPLIRTRAFAKGRPAAKESALLDTMVMKEKHCRYECVSLRAVTDSHNNLVKKDGGLFYLNESARLSGNLLRVHRTLQNDGVVLIKESPALDEQVRYGGFDFTVSGKRLAVHCAGFGACDLLPDEFVPLYGSAVGLYRGGDLAFYRFLRAYHEARHVFREDDAGVYSNTWGNDSGGRKICEKFLEDELDSAHAIGVTHYQVDAGWDTGEKDPATGRSRWTLNRAALPFGFARIREKAEQYGIKIGLWFVPYTEDGCDYACYRQDAETLTALYHEYGATFFKLDGFKLLSFTAAYRFEKMLRLVLERTGSAVFFNMDVTNWPRTGFFGATQYSNLFFENRYTDRISYYPHYTLRNVWEACRYFPACRMQAEFLDTERNAELYEADEAGDALAPRRCGQDYAAAATLFASPLAWLEPSVLSEGGKNALARLMEAARGVRKEIPASLVLPVGEDPDGASFTGFQAIRDEKNGCLLLLRENTAESSHRFRLCTGGFGPETEFKKIVSNCGGEVRALSGSEIDVSMDHPFSYAVYSYRVSG